MDRVKLLIVEDDPSLGQILNEFLQIKGYDTTLVTDGEQGLVTFNQHSFDMCLLDVMMPKKDGFTLAKQIRENDTLTPFIFITAKNMKEDTIAGLKAGADDYITKPFSMEELTLRIEAILRRTKGNSNVQDTSKFQFSDFHFDAETRILNKDQEDIQLTTKESELLRLLLINQNMVLSRSEALKKIWGDDSYFNARSMDVYVAKLRKLLKEDETVSILTIHGQGFKLLVQNN